MYIGCYESQDGTEGVRVMEDATAIEKELDLENYDNWVRWILNG